MCLTGHRRGMNEVIKAIKTRRSIRKFKPDMPKKKDLDKIIEAGLYAANGMGQQKPVIIAITNKAMREKIARDNAEIGGWAADFDPFYGAPVILMVLAEKDWMNRVYDGSLVMGNMMLAAHSLGLGSIWVHRAKQEMEREEYIQWAHDLGLEGEWEGIGHCAVGYIDGKLPKAPARREGRVYWYK